MDSAYLSEHIEKLRNLSDHGQKEVCILIDFFEQYEKEPEDDH